MQESNGKVDAKDNSSLGQPNQGNENGPVLPDTSSSNNISSGSFDDLEEEMVKTMQQNNNMETEEEEKEGYHDYDTGLPEGKQPNNPWGIDYYDWHPFVDWVAEESQRANMTVHEALDPLVKWSKQWANSPANVDSKDWDEVFLDHLRQVEFALDKRKLEEGMAASGGHPKQSLLDAAEYRRTLFKAPVQNQKENRQAKMSSLQKMKRAAKVKDARSKNNPSVASQPQSQGQVSNNPAADPLPGDDDEGGYTGEGPHF